MKKEYILSAAIHWDDAQTYPHQPKNIETGFVVCGRRHHNCFATRKAFIGDAERLKVFKMTVKETQGFITNLDRFVDRKEAYCIAVEANQILDPIKSGIKDDGEPILISEDLY